MARYLLQHGLRHCVEAGRAVEAADVILLDFGMLLSRVAVAVVILRYSLSVPDFDFQKAHHISTIDDK